MFHLYGLEIDELSHVMETFPIVKRNDYKHYQEFRTKRIISEIFTDILDARANGQGFQTQLSPHPGVSSGEQDGSSYK